jgi:acetyl-CoA C-acetyltransferase
VKLLGRLRPGQIVPELPRNAEPRTGLSMGEHTAVTARQWHVSREEQDEIALASHQHAAAAYDSGFFDDLVTPFLGLERDQNLRPDVSMEKLSQLRTVFGNDHPDEATMTAGNSTPLSDGASAVLLGSDDWAREHNLPVLAHIVDAETRAVDYIGSDDGLLTAPIFAAPALLERNGMSLQDFDFYEIHEAFAAQVAFTLKAWEDAEFSRERLGLGAPLGRIDRDKLNVYGSSLAFGHPFAATGGRIVAQLAKMLHAKGKGSRGFISICAAGGNGVVAIMEGA